MNVNRKHSQNIFTKVVNGKLLQCVVEYHQRFTMFCGILRKLYKTAT